MRRTLAPLALIMFVAGCGAGTASDSGAGTSSSAAEATTTDASPTTITAPTTTTAPAPTFRLLTQEELEGSLLNIQDLPAGYSQDPPDSDTSDKTYCNYKPPTTPKIEVTRWFSKGGGMSTELLGINVRQFATPEEAKAAFDAMTDALASCAGETWEGSTLTYSPMSAPELGDSSAGVKMDVDGTALLQFYVLVGPTIIKTGGGGLVNASADEAIGLLESQVQAYRTAAAQ